MSEKQMHVKYSLHALLEVLRDTDIDNKISKKEVLAQISHKLKDKLQEHDKERNNSGNVRWENNLQFAMIGLRTANILNRKNGMWWLLPTGAEYCKKNRSPDEIYQYSNTQYKEWNNRRHKSTSTAPEREEEEYNNSDGFDSAYSDARTGIELHLAKINPYEFQELVAAIIETEGWHIQHISPPGKDGGIDILATRDALGIESPMLAIQVKHHIQSKVKVDASVVRGIHANSSPQNMKGMVVTSSSFTRDARDAAQKDPSQPITLLDFDGLLEIATQNYDKMSDVGKRLLPLQSIYFIKPVD